MSSLSLSVTGLSRSLSISEDLELSRIENFERVFLENNLAFSKPADAERCILTYPLPPSGTSIMYRRKDPTFDQPFYVISISTVYYSPGAETRVEVTNVLYDLETREYREHLPKGSSQKPRTWRSGSDLIQTYKSQLINPDVALKISERHAEFRRTISQMPAEKLEIFEPNLAEYPAGIYFIREAPNSIYELFYSNGNGGIEKIFLTVTQDGKILPYTEAVSFDTLNQALDGMGMTKLITQYERESYMQIEKSFISQMRDSSPSDQQPYSSDQEHSQLSEPLPKFTNKLHSVGQLAQPAVERLSPQSPVMFDKTSRSLPSTPDKNGIQLYLERKSGSPVSEVLNLKPRILHGAFNAVSQ